MTFVPPTRIAVRAAGLGLILAAVSANLAFAQADAPPTPKAGDTAWLLVSTALVLMMSIPGLALFYGGLQYPIQEVGIAPGGIHG